MSLWSRLLRWGKDAPASASEPPQEAESAAEPSNTIDLPAEPYVFECQECGKVFEARRRRVQCPECDSTNVSIVSE